MAQDKASAARTAVQRFILEHSGQPRRATQCTRHPTLAGMTYAVTRHAMVGHGLTPVTRQWLHDRCAELHVKRRDRRGPVAAPDAAEAAKRRSQDYLDRLNADPQRREARLKRMRENWHRRYAKKRPRSRGRASKKGA